MALVEIDLIPYLEDALWDALDNVAWKRLEHLGLTRKQLESCVDYTIKVNYYEEDIKENIE